MSKGYSIYKAINKLNGNIYIGFTSEVWPTRRSRHIRESFNSKNPSYFTFFRNAIRKYGKEVFDWEVIYQSKERDHTLKVMEPYFIKEYDSRNNGYNTTFGGDSSFLGCKHSNKSKQKISEAKKGCVPWNKGKHHSEESKRKISEAGIGRVAWNKGKKNPQGAINGKAGAKKMQQIAIGRKRVYREDETWTWGYPLKSIPKFPSSGCETTRG